MGNYRSSRSRFEDIVRPSEAIASWRRSSDSDDGGLTDELNEKQKREKPGQSNYTVAQISGEPLGDTPNERHEKEKPTPGSTETVSIKRGVGKIIGEKKPLPSLYEQYTEGLPAVMRTRDLSGISSSVREQYSGSGRSLEPRNASSEKSIVTLGDMAEGKAWGKPAAGIRELRQRAAQTENPLAGLVGNSFAAGVDKGVAALVGAGGTLAKGADMTVRNVTDRELSGGLDELSGAIGRAALALRRGDTRSARTYAEDAARLKAETERVREERETNALQTGETALARTANKLDEAYERWDERGDTNAELAKRGQDGVGRVISDVVLSGAQVLGDAAANAVVPGSGLAMLGARAFGDASQRARRSGADVGEQIAYGISDAAVETLGEKLFDGLAGIYGKGTADSLVEKVIERFARAPAGRDALKILSSMGGEAMEEVVSAALVPALESIYSGGDVRDGYTRETASDMAYSALIGGILGGLGGSAEASGIRGANTARETGDSFSAFDRLLQDTTLSPLERSHLASDLADVRTQYAEALRALSEPFSTPEQRALAAQSAIDHADWASRRLGELYPGQDAQAQRELETVAEELEPFTLDEDGEKVLDPFKTVEAPEWTDLSLRLPDEEIGRSVGAKSKNYDILDLSTGSVYHLVEGTKLQNIEVFAGRGTRVAFRDAAKYAMRYGGDPSTWQHAKGIGIINTPGGDARAEIHWVQSEGIGKKEMFVKEWLE